MSFFEIPRCEFRKRYDPKLGPMRYARNLFSTTNDVETNPPEGTTFKILNRLSEFRPLFFTLFVSLMMIFTFGVLILMMVFLKITQSKNFTTLPTPDDLVQGQKLMVYGAILTGGMYIGLLVSHIWDKLTSTESPNPSRRFRNLSFFLLTTLFTGFLTVIIVSSLAFSQKKLEATTSEKFYDGSTSSWEVSAHSVSICFFFLFLFFL